jgi:hypothetical protein
MWRFSSTREQTTTQASAPVHEFVDEVVHRRTGADADDRVVLEESQRCARRCKLAVHCTAHGVFFP